MGRIQVEGGTIDQMRTFYSCLYRTLFFPNRLYELDKNNQIVHYSPYNGKVMAGYMFAGTGFWDTERFGRIFEIDSSSLRKRQY